jgi:excisionase family DNA binding protein
MTTELHERPSVLPSKDDSDLAREASRAISGVQTKALRVRIDDKELILPQAATRLIQHLLTEMAQGNAVTVIPIHAELTTQEAADFLNVSRPHLIRLLEQNKMAYHMVGTHRRIRFEDLMLFKTNEEKKRLKAMEDLAAQAQELGLGY